ncbi:MAG: hypothetical protein QOK16_4746 [Solirubrobacteraceae bacterium]|jgi:hypothetical protein|nr:hypothetical protein [Solirubrobacteraceae bacterium]
MRRVCEAAELPSRGYGVEADQLQARWVVREAVENRARLKRRLGRGRSLSLRQHVGAPTRVERGQPVGAVLVLEDVSQPVAIHVGGRPDGPLDRERDLLTASALNELVSWAEMCRVGYGHCA